MFGASTAWAQDLDADGCDDGYEVGATCVSVHANVGPGIAFGNSVTIAPYAALGGHNSHAPNPLPVGDNVVVGRQTSIGTDHVLGDDTTIGSAVTAGPNLTTQAAATIGYGAILGHNVTLGSTATVGNLVQMANHTTVGALGVVGRSVVIADSSSGAMSTVINGIVGPNSMIGADVTIEQGARVQKDTQLLAGSHIESTGRTGRGSVIEEGATVHGTVRTNGTVGAGAIVSDGAVVLRGGELCAGETLLSGETVPTNGTWPITGCVGGTVVGNATNPSAFDLQNVYIPTLEWVTPRALGTLDHTGSEFWCPNVGLVSNGDTRQPLGILTAPCAGPTGASCGAVDGNICGNGCIYLYSCPPSAPNAALTGATIKVDVTDYDVAWETTWCQAATSDIGMTALGLPSYYSDSVIATMLNP